MQNPQAHAKAKVCKIATKLTHHYRHEMTMNTYVRKEAPSFADKTISFVSEKMANKLKKAKKGDVLISGVSENIEDICKPLGWLGDEICISGDMFAFKHNQNTKFLTYLLQTTDFINYKNVTHREQK